MEFTEVYVCNVCREYGAEPFLRSRKLCRYSRTSEQFMELENSLPCSQEPSIGSWAKSIQFIPPNCISLTSILILSTHLRLGLRVSFLLAFPPISYMYSSSTSIRVTFFAHLNLLDLIILIILREEYKL
jgi:hypothetical protein